MAIKYNSSMLRRTAAALAAAAAAALLIANQAVSGPAAVDAERLRNADAPGHVGD